MKITYALSASGFQHLDIVGCLRKAKQLGYDGVEAAYHDLFSLKRSTLQRYLSEQELRDESAFQAIVAAQAQYGARITGVHGPVVPLNAPDWDRRFWIYRETFKRMALLGAENFTVHAGGGTVRDIAAELPAVERSLRQMAELAGEYGVFVCVESGCMPYELRTVPALAELLNRNPALRHTADLSHNFYGRQSDSDPYCIGQTLELLGDRVREAHVVDHDPALPFCHDLPAGMGKIDWKRFLAGLAAKGFDGVLCCENTPDAITSFLMHVKKITGDSAFCLPASTVGGHCGAPDAGCTAEPDPSKILGHDPFMVRIPFKGVSVAWECATEPWDGTTLCDRLYTLSLQYLKKTIAEIHPLP